MVLEAGAVEAVGCARAVSICCESASPSVLIHIQDYGLTYCILPQNHGLRLINELDGSSTVSTKCARNDEVAIYTEPEANFEAVEQIEAFCKRLPIHVVFGAEVGLVYVHTACTHAIMDSLTIVAWQAQILQ